VVLDFSCKGYLNIAIFYSLRCGLTVFSLDPAWIAMDSGGSQQLEADMPDWYLIY
jgi:hypothetical protein